MNPKAKGYRLPTEAEWEYAARGGDTGEDYQYAGSRKPDEVAWSYANSGDRRLDGEPFDLETSQYNKNLTHRVATKQPNALGLFDLSGNVAEWCHDWYGRYTIDELVDPTGREDGSERVVRGGHRDDLLENLGTTKRASLEPFEKGYLLGFRVVRP